MVLLSHKFVPALLLITFSYLNFLVKGATGPQVEVSIDSGRTWMPYIEPVAEPPAFGHIRISGGSPFVRVPSCALKGSLFVQVWADSSGGSPIGMRWSSKFCNPGQSQDIDGIVVEKITPQTRKPEWLPYTFEEKKQEEQVKTEGKSFWGRYGLYIMLFLVVALAQGIRQGLAEQRMEIEREEQEKRRRTSSGSMHVVVPKRKAAALRKRAPSTKGSDSGPTPS